MGFFFNPFTGNFDLDTVGSTTWLSPVSTTGDLPLSDPDGSARVVLGEDAVYIFDSSDNKWHRQVVITGAFSGTSTAQGLSISEIDTGDITNFTLILHPADSSNPGGVSTGTQNFAGDKTFDNDVIITGDLTVNGTTTTINTATLDVEDQNITVNKNGNDVSAEGAGLTVERTGTDGSLIYEDALASKFKAGELGSEIELANVSSTQTLQNKTIDGTNASGNNTVTTDADQVTYERADGSKKNIQASSDELEAATSDLDDAIGALAASPTNYTPSDATIAADHLSGIDTALGTKVTGPASSVDSEIVLFNGTTGKLVKSATGTGVVKSTSGVFSTSDVDLTSEVTGTLPVGNGGTNSATALNNDRIMVSSGGAIVESAALTNGQLLIGSTGAAPSASTLTEGSGISISNAAGSITVSTVAIPSAGDLNETSFSLADNQSSAANVTGLAFANGTVRSAEVEYSIEIDATADLFETGTLKLIQKGADWDLCQTTCGDNSLVILSVTSSGQIQYTTPSYAGFVSGDIKFRATTTSI